MNPLSDPVYLMVPPAVTSISVFLTVIVLRSTPKNLAKRLFSFTLVSLGLWSILTFLMRVSVDAQSALFWDRMLVPAGFAMFIFYYHFTTVYTRRTNRKLLWLAYSLLATICVLSPLGLIVGDMTLESYGYAPHFSPAMYVIAPAGVFLLVSGLVNLVKARRRIARYEERTRLTYMILAVAFPLIGGVFDLFPGFPPLGMLSNIAFGILTTIAVMKYHLLDIRVVMRKGLGYLLTTAAVASIYVGAIVLLHYVLGTRGIALWIYVVLVIPLAFLMHPLWQRMQGLVDRWFYRERYDFLIELNRFIEHAHDITGMNHLGSSLVNLLNRALQARSIQLLLLSEFGCFTTVASSGECNDQLSLKGESLLAKWAHSSNGFLYRHALDITPWFQALTARERHELTKMGVELLVPLKTKQGQAVGLLLLGKKMSGELYSHEDERLVLAVVERMAIEVENARLYEESRLSEAALRESEAKFRMLADQSPNMIFISIKGKVVYANERCEEVMGYRREDLCSPNFDFPCLVAPEYRDLVSANFKKHMQGVEVDPPEYILVTKDGRRIHAILASRLIDYNGESAILGTVTDITERKLAEEKEKRLQQELAVSNRLASIGELAAGVAHEINNPLTGILGFSERLLRKCKDNRVRPDLQRIHDEALRTAKIVKSLLSFARCRESKKQAADVNNIVQETLDLRAYELATSGIEFKSCLARLPLKVMADVQQLQEVFLNIVLNAEQAMTESNRRKMLVINTARLDNKIVISFADNGPGISAENLDKLFQPFFTTRSEKGGTGLGLSIAHGIVEEHGGKIYAQSELGKGTTFFIELPVFENRVR